MELATEVGQEAYRITNRGEKRWERGINKRKPGGILPP
jgi:hypothetical protein